MKNDPIMAEVYAAKETLAVRFGGDVHALAASFRRLPPWEPRVRPARPIRTAQARLKWLTDPGEIIREVRRVKARIAEENGYDVHRIAAALDRSKLQSDEDPAASYRKPA